MEKKKLVKVIQRRLRLSDEEFQVIEDNPKFQRLFENALAASRYGLVAEVLNPRAAIPATWWARSSTSTPPGIFSHGSRRSACVSS